jgi:transcriptional regulator with XRE-family HTH domain
MAREACGYTVEKASKCFGISERILEGFEQDSGPVPFSLMLRITDSYHIPFDFVYFGPEIEYIERNLRG